MTEKSTGTMRTVLRTLGALLITAWALFWSFGYISGHWLGGTALFLLQIAGVLCLTLGCVQKERVALAIVSGLGFFGMIQLRESLERAMAVSPIAAEAAMNAGRISLALIACFGGVFAYTIFKGTPFRSSPKLKTSA